MESRSLFGGISNFFHQKTSPKKSQNESLHGTPPVKKQEVNGIVAHPGKKVVKE
jgi:hypothetical protein